MEYDEEIEMNYLDKIDWYHQIINHLPTADHWGLEIPAPEEVDRHYQFIMDTFDSDLHEYVNGDVWDMVSTIRESRPDSPLSITHSEAEHMELYVDTFTIIVDYMGLQCWKAEKGIPSRLANAMGWLDYLIEAMRLRSTEDVWDLVQSYHPLALSSIWWGEEQRRWHSRGRVMARCNQIKEELMMNRWHPKRVERLLAAGYDVEEM